MGINHHLFHITYSLEENSKVQAVEHHIEHQQQVLHLLKDNLMLAQNRMKQQANQHRSEIRFDVGDWVFLWLQPYKNRCPSSKAKKDNKLSPKYYGPVQGVAKDWYYDIQIGVTCIFTSTPSFPCFMLKEGYR